IQRFKDMRGKIIGIQNGSSGYDRFEQQPQILKNLVKKHTPVLYDGFSEAFMDLHAGRIDGLLIDRAYAGYYLAHESNPADYTVTTGNFQSESFVVGMRKSDRQLARKINAGFTELRKSGKMAQITRKRFGRTGLKQN
ncbi:transporter substrate-binding domain-containing protein, partial [Lactobacillus sp. XV13L]|nr:transporter substrate-binding domain-containing protein [Lactobacillus sp. XV13L]